MTSCGCPASRSSRPAARNFGDLFGYALAKVRGLPLLYKGADFAETDIEGTVGLLRREGK